MSTNEETLKKLKHVFKEQPFKEFSLRVLSSNLQCDDVYTYVLGLENEGFLIRSKLDINDKPVTHWKLNGSSFDDDILYKSLPRNFEIRKKLQNQFDNNSNDLKLKITRENEFFQNRNTENNNITETNLKKKCCQPPKRLIALPYMQRSTSYDTEIYSDSKSKKHTSLTFNDNSNISDKPASNVPGKPSSNTSSKTSDQTSVNTCAQNVVSLLYEFAQQNKFICQIEVLKMSGPSHNPIISMAASLNGRKFDKVVASNKKDGKILAAKVAIETLKAEGVWLKNISKDTKVIETRNVQVIPTLKKNFFNKNRTIEFKIDTSLLNKMALLVYNEFTNLLKEFPNEKAETLGACKVLSAIIMHDEHLDKLQIVSLATGNRCISGDQISLQGKVINDCHAEIVARRSFMLFIYRQLNAFLTSSPESLNIFDYPLDPLSFMEFRNFKVKSNLKFHLYISTAPCGDGALFCDRTNSCMKIDTEIVPNIEHKPKLEHQVQGLLRSKIEGGEGTIPVMIIREPFQVQSLDGILRGERLKTMSCSDKIARWNYLGIQGALLSQFVEPIFLTSISLGNLYDSGHLCRAVCCRMESEKISKSSTNGDVNHPHLGYINLEKFHIRGIDKSNEFSLNWSYGLGLEVVDGVTGELAGREKRMVCSRIAKASLFHHYLKLLKSIGKSHLVNRYTYKDAKDLSVDYQKKKYRLFEIFHKLEYGSWICKPAEQNNFRDSSYN